MVTSDFRPKVEIQPFRACAMKNMQYTGNPYLWRNFPSLKGNWGRGTQWWRQILDWK